MKSYYTQPHQRQQLLTEASRWEGTPYAHLGRVAGAYGGVGCVWHTVALHSATGALEGFDASSIPNYTDDWSQHNRVSLLESTLIDLGFIERIDGELRGVDGVMEVVLHFTELMFGDVIVFAPGFVTHHFGTVLQSRNYQQALKPRGVVTNSLDLPFRHKNQIRWPKDWFAYGLRFKLQ